VYTDASGTLTTYYFAGGSYEVRDDGTTTTTLTYYAFGGQTVAMYDGESLIYYLTDHLGSIISALDSSGNLLSQQRYLPFGEVRLDAGTITQTDFGYTSQRNLAELGLMDYRARFYSPSLGRFVQADSIVPGAGNPQAFNRYAYVANNPINFTDPSGRIICDEEGNCRDHGKLIESDKVGPSVDIPDPCPTCGIRTNFSKPSESNISRQSSKPPRSHLSAERVADFLGQFDVELDSPDIPFPAINAFEYCKVTGSYDFYLTASGENGTTTLSSEGFPVDVLGNIIGLNTGNEIEAKSTIYTAQYGNGGQIAVRTGAFVSWDSAGFALEVDQTATNGPLTSGARWNVEFEINLTQYAVTAAAIPVFAYFFLTKDIYMTQRIFEKVGAH